MSENAAVFKLHDAEYRLCALVWAHEPLPSSELVKLCEQELQWKKTTTYTVLKKLCNRGILANEKTIVRSLISREQAQYLDSQTLLEKRFQGSLPLFVASFLAEGHISAAELAEIERLIEQYKGGE